MRQDVSLSGPQKETESVVELERWHYPCGHLVAEPLLGAKAHNRTPWSGVLCVFVKKLTVFAYSCIQRSYSVKLNDKTHRLMTFSIPPENLTHWDFNIIY